MYRPSRNPDVIELLRIDKGSRAVIYIMVSGAETMTTTATIYVSYESSYFSQSVHV